tara:strand:+ start:872 stop:1120 length:249 start_codon:yes stop_codon:yes gene_type:complete
MEILINNFKTFALEDREKFYAEYNTDFTSFKNRLTRKERTLYYRTRRNNDPEFRKKLAEASKRCRDKKKLEQKKEPLKKNHF